MNDLDELTDEQLMIQYQEGNELAFSLLYKKYSPKVYGYLLVRLHEKNLADDIFQLTFLKLHQSRDKFRVTLQFAPWLFTICKNAMIDATRKRKRFTAIFDELSDPVQIEQVMQPEPIASPSIPSFNGLSDNQRQVLELRFESGLSLDEVAKEMKLTPSNARKLASRAIGKLKDLIGNRKEGI
jgi:RNA polymerase sigma factor (sigma-70 family)